MSTPPGTTPAGSAQAGSATETALRMTVPHDGPNAQVAWPGSCPPVRSMVTVPDVGRQQPALRVTSVRVIVAVAGPFFSCMVSMPLNL